MWHVADAGRRIFSTPAYFAAMNYPANVLLPVLDSIIDLAHLRNFTYMPN